MVRMKSVIATMGLDGGYRRCWIPWNVSLQVLQVLQGFVVMAIFVAVHCQEKKIGKNSTHSQPSPGLHRGDAPQGRQFLSHADMER
ncbi:hypothetical protein KMAL_14320 [Novacetimonas maltaceti]|uniref:Uncharacterized protein n=1 Tax=Novacetimonas maltaceti TaxID=1203393 RepID=A0A2S3W223_9PROT|nr:hypothetical protein KMAL_14320 [Novacetimonas maltaceti]